MIQISLDDKYTKESGPIFLSGVQALVRLILSFQHYDSVKGRNIATFISGYRGSPLAGVDLTLWQAKKHLSSHNIFFTPGLNEDLAATAVWGSQQNTLFDGCNYEGVTGIWYGKGPGVDRCGDVFKHANFAGTSQYGGVIALIGDDHISESSTLPHQSEQALAASFIPVINPADIQDFFTLGIYALELSRYSGCWVGFKTISETVNSSATIIIPEEFPSITIPKDFLIPDSGLHIRWPDPPLEQEKRMLLKVEAIKAFARANPIDKIIVDAPKAKIGIVTTGKAYLDTLQAFENLGYDLISLAKAGIKIYKVSLTWPLETTKIKDFTKGLKELIIIEEKHDFVETQIKSAFYNDAVLRNTKIIGKFDDEQNIFLSPLGELTPNIIRKSLETRLKIYKIPFKASNESKSIENYTPHKVRSPYYCSGCPHNTSTNVPEGSEALGGIGCHIMAPWLMPERRTKTVTHMGGEGANWLGIQPFSQKEHMFVNLGDGTYHHSGFLAIRACVAAHANITYKILFNDAVAMTGGQAVEGQLTVEKVAWQLFAENVQKIAVCSDDIKKYKKHKFPSIITFHHRNDLDALQKEYRHHKGVSAIIYDQTCAAEKRRRRKRGKMEDPAKRIFINSAVCEGCGDCSKKSNCISVLPIETSLGRKRQIDQSSCNKDYSCVNGFCPSFVSVINGDIKTSTSQKNDQWDQIELSEPKFQHDDSQPWRILITGIGGTGIITVSALLGMAAHIDQKASTCLDMTGLAQKGGMVFSHVQVARDKSQLKAVRIDSQQTDFLFACDSVNAIHPHALTTYNKNKTYALINTHQTITGQFTQNPDYHFHESEIYQSLQQMLGKDRCDFIGATQIATALTGDSIATNLFLLGVAFQKGYIPISSQALYQAIQLNNVRINDNIFAFNMGRKYALSPGSFHNITTPLVKKTQTLDELIAHRAHLLTKYQNQKYAKRYLAIIKLAKSTDKKFPEHEQKLTTAIATYLYKLMAYKDEYEVARLYTDGDFKKAIDQNFSGKVRLKFHLAPPLFAKKDKETGHLKKMELGGWVFPLFYALAKFKFLRGTIFDIFGYSAERKMERQLIIDYIDWVQKLCPMITIDNYDDCVAIFEIPKHIRGFGHIKDQHLEVALKKQDLLLKKLKLPSAL